MANKEAMLDKIARGLVQRGVPAASVVRGPASVSVTKAGGDVITVSYVDKAVQSPMGGVSAAVSPFLGIGVAAPGSLKIKGAAGETAISDIMETAEALETLAQCSGMANDVVIEDGDSSAQLARVRGSTDSIGMGS